MLIEAAKGGHTAVVNRLLDWPGNNPELPGLDSVVVDLPRVPIQGLNNVVPPNDPDLIPSFEGLQTGQSLWHSLLITRQLL